MTGDEMTTGSVHAAEPERRWFARQTRWWNSTGGGTGGRERKAGVSASTKGIGAVKAGDGGVKFRAEWPELDEENWKYLNENKIDPATGQSAGQANQSCSPETAALRRRLGGSPPALDAMVGGGQAARDAGQSWMRRYKWVLGGLVLFGYIIIARVLGGVETTAS